MWRSLQSRGVVWTMTRSEVEWHRSMMLKHTRSTILCHCHLWSFWTNRREHLSHVVWSNAVYLSLANIIHASRTWWKRKSIWTLQVFCIPPIWRTMGLASQHTHKREAERAATSEEYSGNPIDRVEMANVRALHFLLKDHLDTGYNSDMLVFETVSSKDIPICCTVQIRDVS